MKRLAKFFFPCYLTFLYSSVSAQQYGCSCPSGGSIPAIYYYDSNPYNAGFSYQQSAPQYYSDLQVASQRFNGNGVDPATVRQWLGVANDGLSLMGNIYNIAGGMANGNRGTFYPVQITTW